MKIIFDSEEEKKRFFEEMARIDGPCPRNLGVRNSCPIDLRCSEECWEDCILYEIALHDPVKTRVCAG